MLKKLLTIAALAVCIGAASALAQAPTEQSANSPADIPNVDQQTEGAMTDYAKAHHYRHHHDRGHHYGRYRHHHRYHHDRGHHYGHLRHH